LNTAFRLLMAAIKKKDSKTLIDRTTPVTVVNSDYDISGNGGRKLIKLNNGLLVAGIIDIPNRGYRLYKSTDNGNTWDLFVTDTGYKTNFNSLSLVAMGNNIGVLFGIDNDTQEFITYNSNGVIVSPKIVLDLQTAIDNCSLAINSAGTELHACWSSKNSTYPNGFNIRYCKGTINADGSVTWGNVEQVSTNGDDYFNYIDPAIIINNDMPVIICKCFFIIYFFSKMNSTWSVKSIYNGYGEQFSPSACVDKDGIIHIVWHGVDNVLNENRVRYIYSVDGGVTWSKELLIYNANDRTENPSIITNNNGDVFVSFTDYSVVNNPLYIFKKSYGDTEFKIYYTYSSGELSSICDYSDFESPLIIFKDSKNSSIKFFGKWYE